MHALTGKAIATVFFLAVAIAILSGISIATNPFTNPGFEDAGPTVGWTMYGGGAYQGKPMSYGYDFYAGRSLHYGYQLFSGDAVGQDIDLTGVKNISFWITSWDYGPVTGINYAVQYKAANNTWCDMAYSEINTLMNYPGLVYTQVNLTIEQHGISGVYPVRIINHPTLPNAGTAGMIIDDVSIDYGPGGQPPINYNIYEISIVDSMTSGLVINAESSFYDYNTSTWINTTAVSGQHEANLTANHTYMWIASKNGYQPYIENFTANYANGYTVIKSCSLINMQEPLDPALTYITFRVTANSRLTGALIAMDDGQTKLTDGEGVAFFVVPKYEDYNYVVKYTGYYSYYGVFNLTESEYVDVHLTAISSSSPTPTPGPGYLPDYDLGSIDGLTQIYKDLVNASIDKSLNRTYEAFNDTAGWYFLQLNNSASTWHQLFIDQYETPTGYGYVYYDLLDLIFSFIPAQVKAQIAYYFLWIFFLILLGK